MIVFDLRQVDLIRSIDINHNFLVNIIIMNCAVPDGIDHENILARLQSNLLVE